MMAISVADLPSKLDNGILEALRADTSGRPHESRQVLGAHYVPCRPTVPAPKPALVAYSDDAAAQLGLDAAVAWPNLNFRFRNDRSFPVMVRLVVEGGWVRGEIRGAARTDPPGCIDMH